MAFLTTLAVVAGIGYVVFVLITEPEIPGVDLDPAPAPTPIKHKHVRK